VPTRNPDITIVPFYLDAAVMIVRVADLDSFQISTARSRSLTVNSVSTTPLEFRDVR
jgi:hypothetical protein